MYSRIILSFVAVVCSAMSLRAADKGKISTHKIDLHSTDNNWFNLDSAADKVYGISTEKAYAELLKDKHSRTVVVAVIDGGVDINHEDLAGKIWTNKAEIAGNGIDDDNNGYIDDVYGWNFIGGRDGKNIGYESLECKRLYTLYRKDIERLDSANQFSPEKKKLLVAIQNQYSQKRSEAIAMYRRFKIFDSTYMVSDSTIKKFLKKDSFTLADVKKLPSGYSHQLGASRTFMLKMYKRGLTADDYKDAKEYVLGEYFNRTDTFFDARHIAGDDPENMNDRNYGNSDVCGPDAAHGTHVSGIIAANRNNDKGIRGIADNVEIMAIRVVPDGDERDKDIALAIRYAADNGANIINMSFGKLFSPQKHWVDAAVKYAESKNILMVHAAGNDATDMDTVSSYPNNRDSSGSIVAHTWISVGASAYKADKKLTADFSNFGKTNVDIFAPGVDLYSCVPGNKYKPNSGTSMASPVVAGVAALVWSYYPQLSAQQVREIILSSASRPAKLKVLKPFLDGKRKQKVKLADLCSSGGIINVYNALVMAEKIAK